MSDLRSYKNGLPFDNLLKKNLKIMLRFIQQAQEDMSPCDSLKLLIEFHHITMIVYKPIERKIAQCWCYACRQDLFDELAVESFTAQVHASNGKAP